MVIEIKKFSSLNEMINALENELSSEYRFMHILRQNWSDLLSVENTTILSKEISENIRFIDRNSEIFSLKIVYKPGTNTKGDFINNVAGYIQRKSATLKMAIEKLKALSDEEKRKSAIALLIDSIPIIIVLKSENA
ncbi:MAG: hypothetical protein TU36_003930 [Vulcanisaeta sp. AZ3]